MRRRVIALVAAAAALSGCYHVTVISAAPAATVIDKPWQHSFVIGLVPPAEVNTFDQCASGVAKVETEISFVNGLVGLLTQSIYTPLHLRVTCAAPRR